VAYHRERLEQFAFRYWNDALNALNDGDVGDPNRAWLEFWVRRTARVLEQLWDIELRLWERECMEANDHR
jgi:hypothetical protein